MKPKTQHYHQEIILCITRRWPEKCDAAAGDITETDVMEFLPRIATLSATRYNAIVAMLKGTVSSAARLKLRPLTLKDRHLYSTEEFDRLLVELDKRPRSHAGLVVRFLSHTGLRINEARQLCWRDVQADCFLAPGSLTKNGRARAIPFVPGTLQLLDKLRALTGKQDRILPQAQCRRALATACKLAGLPKLTHHDLRHRFATRCITSEVDVPTVARWLGHRDGGALLQRTYFHLVDAHSRTMAARVKI